MEEHVKAKQHLDFSFPKLEHFFKFHVLPLLPATKSSFRTLNKISSSSATSIWETLIFFSYKLSQIVASTALKPHLLPVVDYVAQIRHWHGGGHKHGYETRQVLENGETDVAKNFKIVFSAMAYANLHSNYWMFWLWLLPNALLANGICLKTFEVINVLSPKSYQNFWKSLYRVPEVSDMDTTSVSAS